jgi:hypothetical protein
MALRESLDLVVGVARFLGVDVAEGDGLADRMAPAALEVTPNTLPFRRIASPP